MLRKKLLSLGLAATIVASTGVTAFADVFSGDDTKPVDANVTVTGNIDAADGTAAAGKIQVEIPTRMTFTVDKAGTLKAPTYNIQNQSASGITVSVASFKGTTGNITVKNENEFEGNKDTLDRSNIKLILSGDQTVDLGVAITGAQKLADLRSGETKSIQLLGDAGKKVKAKDASDAPDVDKTGVSEQFDLLFRITKNENIQ